MLGPYDDIFGWTRWRGKTTKARTEQFGRGPLRTLANFFGRRRGQFALQRPWWTAAIIGIAVVFPWAYWYIPTAIVVSSLIAAPIVGTLAFVQRLKGSNGVPYGDTGNGSSVEAEERPSKAVTRTLSHAEQSAMAEHRAPVMSTRTADDLNLSPKLLPDLFPEERIDRGLPTVGTRVRSSGGVSTSNPRANPSDAFDGGPDAERAATVGRGGSGGGGRMPVPTM